VKSNGGSAVLGTGIYRQDTKHERGKQGQGRLVAVTWRVPSRNAQGRINLQTQTGRLKYNEAHCTLHMAVPRKSNLIVTILPNRDIEAHIDRGWRQEVKGKQVVRPVGR